jgi:hypothetical protein
MQQDDIWDLRAERLNLLQQLDKCSNLRRQRLNKQIVILSKKIQRIAGVDAVSSKSEDY